MSFVPPLGVGRMGPDCRYPSHQGCGEVGSCRRLHGRKLAKLAANPFDGSDSLSSEPSLFLPVSGASASRSLVRGSRVPTVASRVRVELPAAMLIQLDDHALVDDLCAHFTRSGFTARSVGGGTAEIARPIPSTEEQDRREILLHLRVWQIINPGATAARRDAGDDASQGPL